MLTVLSQNQDGSPNFECKTLLAPPDTVGKPDLRSHVAKLFASEADAALFYFSGHGTKNVLGGYLVTGDAKPDDLGVPMGDVLTFADDARHRIREVVIILDCCHSGAFAADPIISNEKAVLREGISVLAASRASEPAIETPGGSLFTSLLYAALNGGAADVCGNVTIASVYGFADQVLGVWDQRPFFKAHVSRLTNLRKCNAAVDVDLLRLLPRHFEQANDEFPLDPSYEPSLEPRDEGKEEVFSHLQEFRAARLVVPVGAKHMYYAAKNSKSCNLTSLGQFYWSLAKKGRL
jgi:hypothetical protein